MPSSVPADRTSKQNLPMLYGPEGSENEVLQGYRDMGQVLAKDKFTLKVAAMTARRSWQLTLNNDIKLNLGRGDTTETASALYGTLPSSSSSRRRPTANGLATLICVMTRVRQWAGYLLPQRKLINNRIRHRQNNNDQGDGQKTGSWTGDWHRQGGRFSRGKFCPTA